MNCTNLNYFVLLCIYCYCYWLGLSGPSIAVQCPAQVYWQGSLLLAAGTKVHL